LTAFDGCRWTLRDLACDCRGLETTVGRVARLLVLFGVRLLLLVWVTRPVCRVTFALVFRLLALLSKLVEFTGWTRLRSAFFTPL
jgi:hypothetical protein